MAELLHGDDPEPCDRFPAGPLYVPVRPGTSGCAARLFRTPLGGRTAVGFTSERRPAATLGPGRRLPPVHGVRPQHGRPPARRRRARRPGPSPRPPGIPGGRPPPRRGPVTATPARRTHCMPSC
ncbi:hypothetical protein [Streptomyces sp. NPDC093248]|uniref:hypothetical protein n=1 Tax=Streptomyces sp. NPDC093248 TaxID=3155072 RepID=UPI00344468D1